MLPIWCCEIGAIQHVEMWGTSRATGSLVISPCDAGDCGWEWPSGIPMYSICSVHESPRVLGDLGSPVASQWPETELHGTASGRDHMSSTGQPPNSDAQRSTPQVEHWIPSVRATAASRTKLKGVAELVWGMLPACHACVQCAHRRRASRRHAPHRAI